MLASLTVTSENDSQLDPPLPLPGKPVQAFLVSLLPALLKVFSKSTGLILCDHRHSREEAQGGAVWDFVAKICLEFSLDFLYLHCASDFLFLFESTGDGTDPEGYGNHRL